MEKESEIHLSDCKNTENQTKELALPQMCCALVLIFVVLFGSVWMKLKLHKAIGIGAVRTVLQLSLLGLILVPIFEANKWYIILGYVIFMIVVAACEAAGRCRYFYKGMLVHVAISFATAIALVGGYGFVLVIENDPWYDAQYVIPICGMLLGNSISAISVGFSHFLTELSEGRERVELFLSKGASYWESLLPAFRISLRVGLTPTLNVMSVIGIVSIPGMMTGQILAGNSPSNAAKYQIMIMFLICTTACLVCTSSIVFASRKLFNTRDHQLLSKKISMREGKKKDLLQSLWVATTEIWKHCINICCCFNGYEQLPRATNIEFLPKESFMEQTNAGGPQYTFSKTSYRNPKQTPNFFVASNIQVSVPKSNGERKILYDNLSFSLSKGQILAISGPSGCGKSRLLRSLALLDPLDTSGKVELGTLKLKETCCVTEWRTNVSYIAQSKVTFPGEPSKLIGQILQFRSHQEKDLEDYTQRIVHYLENWNLPSTVLDQPWHELSGGESQRVILAISLALQPRVLLLDEPTSACDPQSVQLIEQTIIESGIASVWVTHDPEQAKRVGHSQLKFTAKTRK
mmetsp:Transcript_34539/g.44076  ORF Transcript_34539/g.44076 Transcript_34539/m.44076 type:complete len:575 (-) Transcript_34539:216-1940(-)